MDADLEHEHQINLSTIEVLGDLGLDYIHRNGFYETADFYGRAVRQVLDVLGKTGLILTQCVSAHSIMPWESTLATIDEWRTLR